MTSGIGRGRCGVLAHGDWLRVQVLYVTKMASSTKVMRRKTAQFTREDPSDGVCVRCRLNANVALKATADRRCVVCA